MKYALAFAGLVAGAFAASECYTPPPATSTYKAPEATYIPAPDSGYFGVIAARSASPIHLTTLTARNGKFYLGAGAPTTYCPAESIGAANCPPGNSTVFAGGESTLSLGVVVPGGQQVYVAPDGALSYTTAHSAFIPTGSIVDQFSKTAPANGNSFGYLNFETGFVACPVGAADAGYQVFGQTDSFKASSDCLGFSALTSSVDEPGAWQYSST
ncbi:hypothetical protein E8E12_003358 [Didymella heteroderae]|uniref:IgE-binding protein n=1 Tax=Didymella heteroderae TaxID=1769908 RepID=A0A9P4WH48_9PLEO|nr:hypothetical protein E8E12_003358 [Didymella heteroderae]